MAKIGSDTLGTGRYAGMTYARVWQEVHSFQGWGGFFTRALYTILHKINGIKAGKNRFVMKPDAVRGPISSFVQNLFTNEIDYETALIVLAAAKAYVLAAERRSSIYWKVEAGGRFTKRDLKWVDLAPLKGLDAVRDAQIDRFKDTDHYRRLKTWLREGTGQEGYQLFPDWVRLYEGNSFYQEIVAWMEANGMLEYEVLEKPAPPVISPPVDPPSLPKEPPKPRQGDLFG